MYRFNISKIDLEKTSRKAEIGKLIYEFIDC
jgi:hypothetical protein